MANRYVEDHPCCSAPGPWPADLEVDDVVMVIPGEGRDGRIVTHKATENPMEPETTTRDEIHTGLPDCHCLACCQEGADCPIHGHVNRKLAAVEFAWMKELAARVDGEVCSICGVQAATLEAGGYRCEEHQHWTASPIRADVEQLLRDVLGYLVDTERAAFISSRRTRDLKQRVEAVVGVKP